MSTRENIRLIARAPLEHLPYLVVSQWSWLYIDVLCIDHAELIILNLLHSYSKCSKTLHTYISLSDLK